MAAVIIQARMGSTRLPGKVLAQLGSSTVLDWVTDRALRAGTANHVIVATTTGHEDDTIADHPLPTGVSIVRGSADDVLSRYALAAEQTGEDVLVRVTADCPLIDSAIIDAAVHAIRDSDDGLDYVSTSLDGRFPRGLDVEAFTRDALTAAHADATDVDEREHVTLHIYRRRDRFRCAALTCPPAHQRPDLRFTVDEREDLDLVRAIVDGVPAAFEDLTATTIIKFLDDNPDIARMNRDVAHRNIS